MSDDSKVRKDDELGEAIIKATLAIVGDNPGAAKEIVFADYGMEDESLQVMIDQLVVAQYVQHGALGLRRGALVEFCCKIFLIGVVYARQEMSEND